MYSFKEGWYVVCTKPRHEKKVAGKLSETGIYNFLPTAKKIKSWSDRKKCIDEPLFPSYLFVYLKDMQNYYQGKDMEGVLYYLKTGKEIARVHEEVINNIKLVVNQHRELELSDGNFQPGRALVINKGALTGLSCEVIQFNGKQKILVRVELLKRHILLTLSSEHLVAI
jgi:transcription antitermination factor NusG